MKKVALSLVGVLAAAAFAPEASALPVFARQTGMACSSCHFQHFPILNSFGRSFKASGYTLMGAQGKVEGDDLSLPDRLNFAVFSTLGIEQETGAAAGHNTIHLPGNGGELSLFFGGRIAENVGFLSEFGASTAPGMASAKMPFLYEVGGGMRAGLVFLTTSGQGPAHSFELLNTGASAVHVAATMPGLGGQHFNAQSAAQYLGTGTGAAGVSAVVVNPDLFFVNIGKYGITTAAGAGAGALPAAQAANVALANTIGGPTSNLLQSTYIRAAMTDIAGTGFGVGVQVFTGHDAALASVETKANIVDFQWMADDIGGMSLLVFGSYGSAPKGSAVGVVNAYNAGNVTNATSLNIGASLEVMKNTSVQASIRQAKNGDASAVNGDNAWQIGATYALAQNVELSLMHTSQSGTSWTAGGLGLNAAGVGQNATSLKVATAF